MTTFHLEYPWVRGTKHQGHAAQVCRKAAADRLHSTEVGSTTNKSTSALGGGSRQPVKPRQERGMLRCYNCQDLGHIVANCPSKPGLYTDSHCPGKVLEGTRKVIQPKQSMESGVARCGEIEGVPVKDIILDTGSARIMIHRDLHSDRTHCAAG